MAGQWDLTTTEIMRMFSYKRKMMVMSKYFVVVHLTPFWFDSALLVALNITIIEHIKNSSFESNWLFCARCLKLMPACRVAFLFFIKINSDNPPHLRGISLAQSGASLDDAMTQVVSIIDIICRKTPFVSYPSIVFDDEEHLLLAQGDPHSIV